MEKDINSSTVDWSLRESTKDTICKYLMDSNSALSWAETSLSGSL